MADLENLYDLTGYRSCDDPLLAEGSHAIAVVVEHFALCIRRGGTFQSQQC